MSKAKQIIKAKPPVEPLRINWDRVLSIVALVIAIASAVASLWQARIAERTRLDVLKIAKDPALHIVGIRQQVASLHHPLFTLVLKNNGKNPAHGVCKVLNYDVFGSDEKEKFSTNDNSCETVAETITEDMEVEVPLGYGPPLLQEGDKLRLRGKFIYRNDDSNLLILPFCYRYIVTDPAKIHSDIHGCPEMPTQ
jgi:hypothetical protein